MPSRHNLNLSGGMSHDPFAYISLTFWPRSPTPYAWYLSTTERNRLVHTIDGNGPSGRPVKGGGKGKKGGKTAYPTPTTSPTPYPAIVLLGCG